MMSRAGKRPKAERCVKTRLPVCTVANGSLIFAGDVPPPAPFPLLPAALEGMEARFTGPILEMGANPCSMSALGCSRYLSFRCPKVSKHNVIYRDDFAPVIG